MAVALSGGVVRVGEVPAGGAVRARLLGVPRAGAAVAAALLGVLRVGSSDVGAETTVLLVLPGARVDAMVEIRATDDICGRADAVDKAGDKAGDGGGGGSA